MNYNKLNKAIGYCKYLIAVLKYRKVEGLCVSCNQKTDRFLKAYYDKDIKTYKKESNLITMSHAPIARWNGVYYDLCLKVNGNKVAMCDRCANAYNQKRYVEYMIGAAIKKERFKLKTNTKVYKMMKIISHNPGIRANAICELMSFVKRKSMNRKYWSHWNGMRNSLTGMWSHPAWIVKRKDGYYLTREGARIYEKSS